MIRVLAGAIGLGLLAASALAADPVEIGIGYLRRTGVKPALSLVEQPAANDGVAGARLAIEDNNTTGRFLNQHFTLEEFRLKDGDDAAKAAVALADRNIGFIIADLPADSLLKAADAVRDRGTVLLNAGAIDDRLREEDCRANVIHAAPTRSMLADGLAQYLVWKQWKRWLLVVGSHEEDKLYAEALRRAATRFGAKIIQERVFEDTGGARRTDSGVTLIQRQMPVFTQQAPAYDVLVAADESEVFASYLPYRTWDPRPIAGSAGLVAKSWDAAQDQWGAVQIQNRFLKLNSRRMTALDMQAWTAARMIGEAVSRTNSSDPKILLGFLRGPDFSVAAFKGQRLTLRDWNLQLRQPILLVDGRMVVTVSPQEGFLHEVSELDTLGVDRPETKCKLH
jgi:ABC transporter substrate binding protein (PQQ-dependent alcohol dehydrogenase system)